LEHRKFPPACDRAYRDATADSAGRRRLQGLLREGEPTRREDPNIDHTGLTFLIDRDGRYRGFFPPGTSADRLIDVIRPLIEGAPAS